MNRDRKYLFNFLSLTIVKVRPHSEYGLHLLCVLDLVCTFLRFPILSLNIANDFLFIRKVSRDTILIDIILICIPESFELPFLGIGKWLFDWVHELNTNGRRIVFAKEAKYDEINEERVTNAGHKQRGN